MDFIVVGGLLVPKYTSYLTVSPESESPPDQDRSASIEIPVAEFAGEGLDGV